MDKHLIIGLGEVGTAMQRIFNCNGIDIELFVEPDYYDYIHICYPYSEDIPHFVDSVRSYQRAIKPKFTIIHSTVPPGTCKRLNAVHSPIIGIHPHLEESIRTFTKFLGGEQASEVADEFRRHGVKVFLFDKSETTELMKILDTTFYGVCLEYVKDVKRQSNKYNVPFEAWKIWTDNYNEGYKKLGYFEYIRPNLVPIMKNLGGHCILPNTELIETVFTELLQKCNAKGNI